MDRVYGALWTHLVWQPVGSIAHTPCMTSGGGRFGIRHSVHGIRGIRGIQGEREYKGAFGASGT